MIISMFTSKFLVFTLCKQFCLFSFAKLQTYLTIKIHDNELHLNMLTLLRVCVVPI